MVFYEIFKDTKYEDEYIALRRAFKVGALASLASLIVSLTTAVETSTVVIMLASFLAGLEKWISSRDW